MTDILDSVSLRGEVLLELRGPDGELKEMRHIENLVVTLGKEAIADQMLNAPTLGKPKFIAVGKKSTAPAEAAQKALEEQDGTRKEVTTRTRAGKVVTVAVEFTAGEHTATLKEAGVFTEAAGEVMMARTTFEAIPKGAEDTLTVTWKIEVA